MIRISQERRAALDRFWPSWQTPGLWQQLEQSCAYFAKRPYLVFEDHTYTYAETLAESLRTARALLVLGVRPGDHVAIVSHNRPEYIFLIYALSRIGAVEVPVNVNIRQEELAYVLARSDTAWLFAERQPDDFPPRIRGAVLLEGKALVEDWLSYSAFFAQSGKWHEPLPAPLAGTGMCGIMYTSGSTSRPKGVILIGDMLLRSAYSTCLCRGMEEGRRICVPIPLFHAFAMVEGLLAVLFCGGSVMMTRRRFDAAYTLELMRRFAVNDIICVSVIMHDLLTKAAPRPEDFPQMHAAHWASACADWIWEAGRQAFGIQDVTTSYGMTECGSTTVMLTPEDAPDRPLRCHGRLKPAGVAALPDANGHQFLIRLTDPDTGKELTGLETSGELCCKGPTITPGYYNAPEANAAAFDAEGWFHTGDLVRFDKEGYMTFLGRINDMYKINGENVSPSFVDSILGGSEYVREVETVGVPHPKYGEVSIVFVELTEDTPQARCAVRCYGHQHLANFQQPRYYCFSARVLWPHTSSDKVSKSRLREAAGI